MAKRRYSTDVNSLSYANAQVPYVAQPTKEILGLLDKREDQYIETKNNINIAEELKKSIPYVPNSKGVYDEIVTNINKTLDGITPENYADNVLNSAQLSKDAINKWGGKELKEQYDDYITKSSTIAKTPDIRPQKLEYYQSQLTNSIKGIVKNPDGTFIKGNAVIPNLVKDRDLYKEVDDLMQGWKENSYYIRDDKTGELILNDQIKGLLGTTKHTFNDEKELFEFAFNYLTTKPEVREYLESEADFRLSKTGKLTPEEVLSMADSTTLKVLFPDKDPKNVKVEDIVKFSGGNPDIFKDILKQSYINSIKNTVASDMTSKYNFSQDEMTFQTDLEEAEKIKAKYAQQKEEAKNAGTVPLAFIKTAPLTTIVTNPNILENYDANDAILNQEYTTAKEELNNLDNEIKANPNNRGHLQALRQDAYNRLQEADKAIEANIQAKKNIVKATMTLASNNGLTFKKDYEANIKTLEEEAKVYNVTTLVKNGFKISVNHLNVKPEQRVTVITPAPNLTGAKAGKYDIINTDNKATNNNLTSAHVTKLNIPGYSDTYFPIYDKNGKEEIPKDVEIYVEKDKNNYNIVYNKGSFKGDDYGTKQVGIIRKLMKEDEQNLKRFKVNNGGILKRPPTLADYEEAVTRSFLNDNEDYQSDFYMNYSAKNSARKLKEKNLNIANLEVQDHLDYLFISDKAAKGTAAFALNEANQSMGKTFRSDGSNYKVTDVDTGEFIDLPLMLKKMGIEFSDAHIDFDATASNIRLATTSDRKYGPHINMNIVLTKDGREAVKGKSFEPFARSGTINFKGVNSLGKNTPFNINLQEINYKAFKESYKKDSPASEENRKAYGLIEFQNSRWRDDFDRLNLYTLGDGDERDYMTPFGEEIKITAVKRSANPTKLGDNDYYLRNKNGDIFVQPLDGSRPKFIPYTEYTSDEQGQKYRLQMYASPEDIQAELGKALLLDRALSSNAPEQQIQTVKTTGTAYTIKPDAIISNNHSKNVNKNKLAYAGKQSSNKFINAQGKEQPYNTMVKPNELVSLNSFIKGKYSGIELPYVHKSIQSSVGKLVNDYNLVLTGALRSVDKNKNTEGAAENSGHLFGKSIDARFNNESEKLLADLRTNPQLANDLGISYAFKHTVNGVPHLHIDFI